MATEKQKTGFAAYMGTTFLIGFGFFTMGLMDPLYDTYVPIFLRRYVESNALVGAIMTLDNVLQLILIPIIAVWSDRTRTRIGRRMPFIVVMLPVSAVLFYLLPMAAAVSLWALIVLLFCFNIFKTSVRGPVVALMPDTIPGDYRSEANGVINMMGGVGAIIGTLGLAQLMKISEGLPFTVAGGCIILAVVVLLLFVREKLPEKTAAAEKPVPVFKAVKMAFTAGNSSVPRILIALFCWFLGYEGVKPFLGLYMVEVLGVAASNAALAQGIVGVASVAFAVPVGYFAHKLGRKRYIRLCLVLVTVILLLVPACTILARSLGMGPAGLLVLCLGLLFLFGAFWIGITVNSFPMLWQLADFGNMGIFTGLYYTFSQSAAIVAPPITGLIIDLGGYQGIFVFSGLCMLAAWFVMRGVSAGEAAAGEAAAGEAAKRV
ncbi:MAG: MFS transporter [Treponema sp.]|jgi:MFS family permease|nr:MFS transporter [Treponema sp.]